MALGWNRQAWVEVFEAISFISTRADKAVAWYEPVNPPAQYILSLKVVLAIFPFASFNSLVDQDEVALSYISILLDITVPFFQPPAK
jgi:hypothetical protein